MTKSTGTALYLDATCQDNEVTMEVSEKGGLVCWILLSLHEKTLESRLKPQSGAEYNEPMTVRYVRESN